MNTTRFETCCTLPNSPRIQRETYHTEGGYIRGELGRPMFEIVAELNDRLEHGPDPVWDGGDYGGMTISGASLRGGLTGASLWPVADFWGLACYAVTGGSEGHYVHVDALMKGGARESLLIGKTFGGMAEAQAVAARCAVLLGA